MKGLFGIRRVAFNVNAVILALALAFFGFGATAVGNLDSAVRAAADSVDGDTRGAQGIIGATGIVGATGTTGVQGAVGASGTIGSDAMATLAYAINAEGEAILADGSNLKDASASASGAACAVSTDSANTAANTTDKRSAANADSNDEEDVETPDTDIEDDVNVEIPEGNPDNAGAVTHEVFTITKEVTATTNGLGEVTFPTITLHNPIANMGAYDNLALKVLAINAPDDITISKVDHYNSIKTADDASRTWAGRTTAASAYTRADGSEGNTWSFDVAPGGSAEITLGAGDGFKDMLANTNLSGKTLIGELQVLCYYDVADDAKLGGLYISGMFQAGYPLKATLSADAYPSTENIHYIWYSSDTIGGTTTLLQHSASDMYTPSTDLQGKYITAEAHDCSGAYKWTYTSAHRTVIEPNLHTAAFDLYYGQPTNGTKGFYANPQLTIGVEKVEMEVNGQKIPYLKPKTENTGTDVTMATDVAPILTETGTLSLNYSIWGLATYEVSSNQENLAVYPTLRRWRTTDVEGQSIAGFDATILKFSANKVSGAFKVSGTRSNCTAKYLKTDNVTTSPYQGWSTSTVTVTGSQSTAPSPDNGSLVKIESNAEVTITLMADQMGNAVEPVFGDVDMAGGNGGCFFIASGGKLTLDKASVGKNAAYGLDGNALGTRTTSTGANAGHQTGTQGKGGGIYADGANITLTCTNTTFEGHIARKDGETPSAIFIDKTDTNENETKTTIENCTFNDNKVFFTSSIANSARSAYYGAAIMACSGSLTVTGSTFTNNVVTGDSNKAVGGAISIRGYQTSVAFNIQNSTFDSNQAGLYGGAVFIYNQNDVAENLISNCTFTNNSTVSNSGGAIFLDTGKMYCNSSYFGNNAAGNNGGAIYILNEQTHGYIANCYFYGNSGASGGAVENYSANDIIFENNTFDSNTSTNVGGALYHTANQDTIYKNCLFKNNYAPNNGGAVATYNASGKATFDNCIFTSNGKNSNSTTNTGGAINVSNTNTSFLNCELSYNTCANWGGAIHTDAADNTIEIENCLIEGNKLTTTIAERGSGGVLINKGKGQTVKNTVFRNNYSGGGSGALEFKNNVDNSKVTNCTFENNTSNVGVGGAIRMQSSGTMDVESCVFDGNTSLESSDGATSLNSSGTSTFTNNVFINNSSHVNGGAIGLSNTAKATFAGNTFEGNKTRNYGAGIMVNSSAANALTVSSSVFDRNVCTSTTFTSDNSGPVGGGIYTRYSITVTDSDFTRNEAWGGAAVFLGSSTYTLGSSGVDFSGQTSDAKATLTLTGCRIYDNIAQNPDYQADKLHGTAAIGVQRTNSNTANRSVLTFTNTYVYDNKAKSGAAGIWAVEGTTLTPTATEATGADGKVFDNTITTTGAEADILLGTTLYNHTKDGDAIERPSTPGSSGSSAGASGNLGTGSDTSADTKAATQAEEATTVEEGSQAESNNEEGAREDDTSATDSNREP
jgi:hypothetical protein